MPTSVQELAEELAKPSRVLIVDDSVPMCQRAARALKKLGCVADCVYDGGSALDYLKAAPKPSMVLLDIVLPDMSGIAIVAWMRELNMTIPVVVITGFPSEQVNELITAYGVVAVVTKPIGDITRTLERYLAILNIKHTAWVEPERGV